MTLALNSPSNHYREFFGRYNTEMPKLIAEGRTPMSVAELVRRRLEVANSIDWWLDNSFDTGDAIAYHPDRRFKIIRDVPLLRSIGPKSTLRDGALILTDDQYHALPGIEFRANDRRHFNHSLTQQEAVASDALAYLLGTQAHSLICETFALGRAYGYDRMLGLYLRDSPRESPELRAWLVDRVSDGPDLYGNSDLDLADNARLVGVAPIASAHEVLR